MNQQAAQRAIKAALEKNWNEAVEYNIEIIQLEPENVEALNRLARAYFSIGQSKNAKKTWNKVLRIDRYNPIASKQLEKLKSSSLTKTLPTEKQTATNVETFLDEPGKTKTTKLVRVANPKTLLKLEPAQAIKLIAKKRLVTVATQEDEYLGSLPDDLSSKLVKFIKGGNKYDAIIRRVEKNNLSVFIKETKKSKRFQNIPSFSLQKSTKPIKFEPTQKISQPPIDITPTGEEDQY